MPSILFISDLHLHPDRADIQTLFFRFLANEAHRASALYILGDLFEFWIGDDDKESPYNTVLDQLRKFSQTTPVYFMPGNRDFLTGQTFTARSGCTLLNDPVKIDLFGTPVLLMHGDTLCTDDIDYQNFRQMVRSSEWQDKVMQMSIDKRVRYFHSLRETSQQSIRSKPAEFMDVNQLAVEDAMRTAHVKLLIHGHTHRPAIHEFELDQQPVKRIVLGDWYEHGSVLEYSDNGEFELREIQP